MKQLHPRAVWLFFINLLTVWLFALAVIGIYASVSSIGALFAPESSPQLIWISRALTVAPFVMVVLAYVFARLTYRFYRYELTDLGFKKESGIIWKSYVTIPYEKIQNVDIHRGVWARVLGLSDIQIQTAGMSAVVGRYGTAGVGAEGRLPGLSEQDAELLRDELVRRASHSRNSGV